MSSAYLRLLIFLPTILIPASASSIPALCMLYSFRMMDEVRCSTQGSNLCLSFSCTGRQFFTTSTTYVHIYMHACVYIMYIYINMCLYINVYILIYVYIYINIHLNIFIYIYTNWYIYIHLYTYIHLYIHIYVYVYIKLIYTYICIYKIT